jgi:hypothetical protein
VPEAGRRRSCVRGRLLAAGGVLGAGLVLGSAAPVAAEVAGPATLCKITDPRLAELSGMVEVPGRLLALNDGGDQIAVHVLDGACRVVDTQTAAVDPFDPEDLSVGPDGTVWIADIGDNGATRPTVALIAIRPDGATALYRLTYPDGAHDAEALLIAPDGTPYVVTKEVLGASSVYRPVAGLVDGGTVALGKVTTVTFTLTGTPGGPVGRAGQLLVTGGAVAPDGRHLALRTYTDAYVWPLSGSDVVAALTSVPARVALPESPQGEAITFTSDGASLVVGSEGLPSDVTVVPLPVGAAAPAGETAAAPTASLTDFTSSGLSPITSGIIAACVATLVVWLGGLLRRRSKP